MANQRTQDLEALHLIQRELLSIREKKNKIASWQNAIREKKQSNDKLVQELTFTPSEKRKRLDAEYRYYYRKETVKIWKVLCTLLAILGTIFALFSCIYLFSLAATKISSSGFRWLFYILHSILCLILVFLLFSAIPSPGYIGSDEEKEAKK